MTENETLFRKEFDELKKKTPPRMLTELHYGITHREDKPDLVNYNLLVGYIDTATQFSVDISKVDALKYGKQFLKCKIIHGLYDTINLLEDCIEKLR